MPSRRRTGVQFPPSPDLEALNGTLGLGATVRGAFTNTDGYSAHADSVTARSELTVRLADLDFESREDFPATQITQSLSSCAIGSWLCNVSISADVMPAAICGDIVARCARSRELLAHSLKVKSHATRDT